MFRLLTSVLPSKDEHNNHKNLIYLHIEIELVFFLRICKTSSIFIESSQHVSHILNHEFKWNDKFSKTELRMSSQSSITLRIRKSINRHNKTKFVWHVKVHWVWWQQAQSSNIYEYVQWRVKENRFSFSKKNRLPPTNV